VFRKGRGEMRVEKLDGVNAAAVYGGWPAGSTQLFP
jgi:hypothetical protein